MYFGVIKVSGQVYYLILSYTLSFQYTTEGKCIIELLILTNIENTSLIFDNIYYCKERIYIMGILINNKIELINPKTNKTWVLEVDGNKIYRYSNNKRLKQIEAEYINEKVAQLITAQLKKGYIYSDLNAENWNPCFHTYIENTYPGFMPIAANTKIEDFYVIRVKGQFEDEKLFHFDSFGTLLNVYHLGKNRLTFSACLMDNGAILMYCTYADSKENLIEVFYPDENRLEKVESGDLLDTFCDWDNHVTVFNNYRASYIGYNNPYKRRIVEVENIQKNTIFEIINEFIRKDAFCAFSSRNLIVHTDRGVLSLYNIP